MESMLVSSYVRLKKRWAEADIHKQRKAKTTVNLYLFILQFCLWADMYYLQLKSRTFLFSIYPSR